MVKYGYATLFVVALLLCVSLENTEAIRPSAGRRLLQDDCNVDCSKKCCKEALGITACEPVCKTTCEGIKLVCPVGPLCEAVGEAGGRAYVAGGDTMRNRASDPAESLSALSISDPQKAELRECFGDLVDSTELYFDVAPLDRYEILGRTFQAGSAAQTFGHRIYFSESLADVSFGLVKHEMAHVKQFDGRGRDLNRFGRDYFEEWCKGGFEYAKNALEREADTYCDTASGDTAPPAEVCQHNCRRCGQKPFGGDCKKCCWTP